MWQICNVCAGCISDNDVIYTNYNVFGHKSSHSVEFSLNGAELSLNSVKSENSENLRNHWTMNLVQYKDLLCYLWLCGLVVSFLSLTQEILGSSPTLLIFYFLKFFCHWIQRIQWKHLEKTPVWLSRISYFWLWLYLLYGRVWLNNSISITVFTIHFKMALYTYQNKTCQFVPVNISHVISLQSREMTCIKTGSSVLNHKQLIMWIINRWNENESWNS